MTIRFRPPAPRPRSPLRALFSTLVAPKRDLLTLLPESAYETPVARLGRSRRGIVLVNDPALVREVLVERADQFAKNDLFTGALAPLIGNGVFISRGAAWRRQRAMIEPGFEHLRAGRAFAHMVAAVRSCTERLDASAGSAVRLDAEMSRLTADIMYRVIFTDALAGPEAAAMFDAFARFQATVANVRITALLLGKPFSPVPQPAAARDAAQAIRAHLADMVDARLASGEQRSDLLGAIIAARDGEGRAFSREEMIDQIAVFFLAGHETTASTLTWLLLILSQQPKTVARLRAEVSAAFDPDEPQFSALGGLLQMRSAIFETLRLYPPGAFLPRVALEATQLGHLPLRRGAMVLISPWIIHRHRLLWDEPDVFDPMRFGPDAPKPAAGTYLPFGLGPRGCIGGSFALAEAQLVAATLLTRYRLRVDDAASTLPAVHLTLRPSTPVMARFETLRSA